MDNDNLERMTLPFDGVCEIKKVLVKRTKFFGDIFCVEMETLAPSARKKLTWVLRIDDILYAKEKTLEWIFACKKVCKGSIEASALEDRLVGDLSDEFLDEFVGSVCRVLAEPVDFKKSGRGRLPPQVGRGLPRDPATTFFFSAYRGESRT